MTRPPASALNFSVPPADLTYRDEVVAFAQRELNSDVGERESGGRFDRELWQKCAAFGILELAGTDRDLVRAVVAMEGLGYGCIDTGLVLGLNAQMWCVQRVIDELGSADQKRRFLHPLRAGGAIGCHALTEPGVGSDVYAMQATATPVEGGYLLNGTKRLITLAPVADLAIVFASTRPDRGKWGLSAFIVEATAEGYVSSPARQKMGLRTVPIGEITLTDCFVPTENRIGAEGAGLSIANHSLEYDRCFVLSGKVGTMQRQLEESIAFARDRRQFDRPIAAFQSISNRIADMRSRVDIARLLLYRAAALKQAGHGAAVESSILKLYLSEAFVASSLDAIRIGGGNAYLTDFGTERDLRDAVGSVLYAGTSDIQRNLIASLSGL